MSAHGTSDDIPPEISDPTYEDRDINLRALGVFGLIVVIVAILTWISMSIMFDMLNEDDSETLRSIPTVGPRLQAFPVQELVKYDQIQQDHLQSYSWVDQTNSIAAIPIDIAMKIALQTEFGASMDKLDVDALAPHNTDGHDEHGHDDHGHGDHSHGDHGHDDHGSKDHDTSHGDAEDHGDSDGSDSADAPKPAPDAAPAEPAPKEESKDEDPLGE